MPKPATAQEALDNKKIVDLAFKPEDEKDLETRIKKKVKECSIEVLSLKEVMPETIKAAVDAASEATKKPGATSDSVTETAWSAAQTKASEKGVTLPLGFLQCAVEKPIGLAIAGCGVGNSACFKRTVFAE